MRFLASRVPYKTLILICTLLTVVTVVLWNRCNNEKVFHSLPRAYLAPPSAGAAGLQQQAQPPEAPPVVKGGVRYEEIDCLINDDVTVKGRREGTEVYMPFSWIEKYFEVYGKVVQYDGYDRFEFSHSYSKVYNQRDIYRPSGVFMSFEGYNVEVRDRVKCISGVEGVPLSTQWGSQGYFYAIQIAQYGLSHFSKNLTERAPHVEVYDTAEEHNSKTNSWSVPKGCTLTANYDKTRASTVHLFNAPVLDWKQTCEEAVTCDICNKKARQREAREAGHRLQCKHNVHTPPFLCRKKKNVYIKVQSLCFKLLFKVVK